MGQSQAEEQAEIFLRKAGVWEIGDAVDRFIEDDVLMSLTSFPRRADAFIECLMIAVDDI